MSDLRSRVLRHISARALLKEGDDVLIALSGGVDSFVLLDILNTAFKVHPAHFDHGMRAESEAEAERVRQLVLARYERPTFIVHADPGILAGENAARIARYRFLDHAMRMNKCDAVALGHHADDQVETILFRLLRGAGTHGLAGMPVRRGPYIRPLLPFWKSEIQAYARSHDIEYVEDASNRELHYARNRIRHVLLPALERAQPDARAKIMRLSRHAARVEKAWKTVLDECERDVVVDRGRSRLEVDRSAFLRVDGEHQARLLRRALRRFGMVPSRATTAHLLDFVERGESGSIMKIGDVEVERAFDRILIRRVESRADDVLELSSNEGNSNVRIGTRTFEVRWKLDWVVWVETLHFKGPRRLVVRGFRPGDRIRLPYGTKKLKKLFAERRIAASERSSIPLVVDENGAVLYVHGVARALDEPLSENDPILNVWITDAEPS